MTQETPEQIKSNEAKQFWLGFANGMSVGISIVCLVWNISRSLWPHGY